MKICIVSENYQKGGIDTFLFSLISSWVEPKDEITLLLNTEHSSKIELKSQFANFIKFIEYENLATTLTFRQVQLQESSIRKVQNKLFSKFESVFIFLQFPK